MDHIHGGGEMADGFESAEIRAAVEEDLEAVLRLNDAEVRQTSDMDESRLRQLHALSGFHKVAVVDGRVVAFLLAMRETAAYGNENFEWFASRYTDFLYIDRIVVSRAYARRRIGTALYMGLFGFAARHGVSCITCEYNVEPPNLPSRAFHAAFGFREVGRQRVAGNSKLVSMQLAEVELGPGGS